MTKRSKRLKLIEARTSRDWTLETASSHIGCAPNTLNRWELGATPSAYYRAKLCKVYGSSKEELGLDDENIPMPVNTTQETHNLQTYIQADLTTQLMAITFTPSESCWMLQQELSRIIDEATEPMRTEALQRVALLPLLLKGRSDKRTAEEVIHECAAGLTACGYLAAGERKEMECAYSVLGSYVPLLQAAAQGKYEHVALALLSQTFQLKSRISYHLEGTKKALLYAEQGVSYARQSQNRASLVLALRELTGAYEWTSGYQKMNALQYAEEAAYLIEQKRHTKVSPVIESWVYTGLAKYQALHRKPETFASLAKAEETFFAREANTEHIPPYINHSHARLIRHRGIAFAYLGRQDIALETFGQIIDIESGNFNAKLPVAARTHLGILSEAMFASLKLPRAKKDKELSIALWKAVVLFAQRLQSETYLNEANLGYQIMEGIWSGDNDIIELQDLLIS